MMISVESLTTHEVRPSQNRGKIVVVKGLVTHLVELPSASRSFSLDVFEEYV